MRYINLRFTLLYFTDYITNRSRRQHMWLHGVDV